MKPSSDLSPPSRSGGRAVNAATSVLDNPLAFAAAFAVIVSIFVALAYSRQIHHDAAWLLIAAERLLDGANIYVDDVIETNPPLILILYTPAVLLGRLFGVAEPQALNGAVLLLCLVSLAACNRILQHLLGDERDRLRRALLLALAYLAFIEVRGDFAQRDHLLWLLLTPYLLLLAARMQDAAFTGTFARLIGIGAGIAVSLKPHYLFAMAVPELALALRRGSLRTALRPEAVAAVATGGVYVLGIAVFLPAYFDLARGFLIASYWGLTVPLAWIIRQNELLLLAACAVGAFLVRRRQGAGSLAWVLLLAATSFYGAMLFQHTGWVYHRIPFRFTAILLLALVVFEALPIFARSRAAPRDPTLRYGGAALAAVAAASLLLVQPDLREELRWGARWRAGKTAGPIDQIVAVMNRHASPGSVLFLTPEMNPLPGMIYSEAKWASRFSSLWPLAAVIRGQRDSPDVPDWFTAARRDALEQTVRDAVIADLERYRPELIFVDLQQRNRLYGPAPFDILAFFREDPRFEAIWSGYQPAPQPVANFAYAIRRP